MLEKDETLTEQSPRGPDRDARLDASSDAPWSARPDGSALDHGLVEGVLSRRVVAWVIDSLLTGIVLGVLWVVLFLFGIMTLGLGMPLLGGLWVVPILYTFLFVASPANATPGQALAGLCVVRDEDLGRPTPAQAAVFAIGYWVSMAAGVVWLAAAFFTYRSRCLHDIVSGLLVAPAEFVQRDAEFRRGATLDPERRAGLKFNAGRRGGVPGG